MTLEGTPASNADGDSIENIEARVGSPSLNSQPPKNDSWRRNLSSAALAAAVAAIALPLTKIKSVLAASDHIMEYCAADEYGGFDRGDVIDCTDCALRATPSDCYLEDTSGGIHWGKLGPTDTPTPDSSCSSCGNCAGCGGGGGDEGTGSGDSFYGSGSS
jgi:hypothetical protein